MPEEKTQNSHIGFINPATWDPKTLVGTLNWGAEKYRIRNIISPDEGKNFVGDVQKKTDKMWTAKNGNEYPLYEDVGAVKWDTETGDGNFVTDVMGVVVKYKFTSKVETLSNGSSCRILRFGESVKTSSNKFRSEFEDAQEGTIVDEIPDVPF